MQIYVQNEYNFCFPFLARILLNLETMHDYDVNVTESRRHCDLLNIVAIIDAHKNHAFETDAFIEQTTISLFLCH